MKRVLHAAGAALAAAALCLTTATSAVAAEGVLIVGNHRYEDPHGCYTSELWPLSVTNDTDTDAYVYGGGTGCAGKPIAVVRPGERGVFEFGAAVSIR
ncbi:hypothetical protein ACFVXG_14680 [Kitasatospora sp. NPDC058162]|uniref:hypothetical protein n=1 Tax=Kitasatospora sp. NPDC058162 TaxID=3346362 RepID=UPI0036D82C0C